MLRRSFLKALFAAPIAIPAAAKAIAGASAAAITGEEAFAAYSVVLEPSGYVSGFTLKAGEITSHSGVFGTLGVSSFSVEADKFEIVRPGEGPICKYVVAEVDGAPRVIENPEFDLMQAATG